MQDASHEVREFTDANLQATLEANKEYLETIRKEKRELRALVLLQKVPILSWIIATAFGLSCVWFRDVAVHNMQQRDHAQMLQAKAEAWAKSVEKKKQSILDATQTRQALIDRTQIRMLRIYIGSTEVFTEQVVGPPQEWSWSRDSLLARFRTKNGSMAEYVGPASRITLAKD